ncbi:hypothetical protein CspHIS471_0303040 [Cutaneotrichosporon sp. HIS471]|nr:hypothetical protein CspHIS471_0303040 [Cutaneotrichosporon sp. HIS471]
MYSCLALGYVRLRSFPDKRHAREVPDNDRTDVPYFRHAVHLLDKWGNASFTSLHTLSGLWFYSTLACTSETCREIVSWMISQAKELGIHQDQGSAAYSPADRADLMFVQVLYSHYWTTALTGRPPLIRPGEFENMTFRSRPVPEDQAVVLVPRRSLMELLVLNTQLMMNLHDSRNARLSLDWLLRIEDRWDTWCATWVSQGRTTGNKVTDPFLSVLWDWGRLTVRAVTLNDSRLSMSSLAVLTRSATKIIACYYDFYLYHEYNLMWLHFRHLVTCAHIVIIAHWRFELTKPEAEIALSHALWMIGLMEARWGRQASEARRKILQVANALSLPIAPPATPAVSEGSHVLGYDGQDMFDQNALGVLYEAFDAAVNAQAPMSGGWTIDSLFLAPDYPQ